MPSEHSSSVSVILRNMFHYHIHNRLGNTWEKTFLDSFFLFSEWNIIHHLQVIHLIIKVINDRSPFMDLIKFLRTQSLEFIPIFDVQIIELIVEDCLNISRIPIVLRVQKTIVNELFYTQLLRW